MLQNIVDLLQVVNGETKRIRFAQGCKHLPNTVKGGILQTKKEIKWEKRDK